MKDFFTKRSPKGLEESEKAVNMENLEGLEDLVAPNQTQNEDEGIADEAE